ncbi:MAG: addiction module toxin RelE [Prevotellaceae bacterium]|jgi:mRNA-degrading endonuclease RelE of RelBE toxin-antitoxin system|nr:addiction module toxin RelE [Prevotellaceae bacterium]
MIQITTAAPFEKELKKLRKKYHSIAQDYEQLLNTLQQNPYAGVDLGKGLRKVRMAIHAKGRGKSYGARIITYTDAIISVSEGVLLLLYIYDKGESDNVSKQKIDELLNYVNRHEL